MSTDVPKTSQLETIEMATTALFSSLAVFTAIKEVSNEHSQAHRLAIVGEYLTQDQGNMIDCLREEFQTLEESK